MHRQRAAAAAALSVLGVLACTADAARPDVPIGCYDVFTSTPTLVQPLSWMDVDTATPARHIELISAGDERQGRHDQRSAFLEDQLGDLRKAQRRTARGVRTWTRLPSGDIAIEFFSVDWGFTMQLHVRDSATIEGAGRSGALRLARFRLLARPAPCQADRTTTPP